MISKFQIPLISGATARIWSASLVSPLELVRTKMQSKRLSYLEIGQALRSLLQYHGVTGLWKGLDSTLLRDVPFSAIYWVHYEWFKANFIPLNNVQSPNVAYSFLGGALSGSVSCIFIFKYCYFQTILIQTLLLLITNLYCLT